MAIWFSIKYFDSSFDGYVIKTTSKLCLCLSNFSVKLMVENPYETRSDTFYFVDGKLVMHNKAEYSYNEPGEGI